MNHGQCLTEETLTEYLEGRLDPAVKTACEVHLIECDHCREELAFFIRVLSPEITREESWALETIQQQWEDRRPAPRLPSRPSYSNKWLVGLAAAAASLAIGFVTFNYVTQQSVPSSPTEVVDALLSSSEQRPFDARISGQPYRPLFRTRGLEQPQVAYGPLAGEMTRLSADSHDMGRFYLIQKDFSRALAYLVVAEQEVGAGPDVHNDLGVAYLEGGGLDQLEKAGEEFRHALNLDPSFAIAAFNLAVFYERSGNFPQAEVQWRRFLQLDPDSAWTKEARSRLEGILR
jgi:tetratricopeptide (TPR) repeat protein